MTSNLDNRLAAFDRHLDATVDPAHRAMIQNFKDHNRYEQTGDVEALLGLYRDDAEFHVYGTVFGPARETHLAGKDAIRERYERMFASYVSQASDPEAELEVLTVSDWGVTGIFHSTFEAPGSLLASSGYDIAEDGATYRLTQRLAFFRGFQDGLVSSMTYVNSAPTIEAVAEVED